MARLLWVVVFAFAVGAWGQNSASSPSPSPSSSAPLPDNPQPQNPPAGNAPPGNRQPANTKSANSKESSSTPAQPKFEPPSSNHVDAGALPEGESSSKDDDVDLTPPAGDAKAHPNSPSSFGITEAPPGSAAPSADVNEMHPWNPHRAAKDIEVGDFYFKQKNYRAAESRYREALTYKDNDAVATYRLAVSLEKLSRFDEAKDEYESYLRILPHGPEAGRVKKALERLKSSAAQASPGK